MLVNPETHHVDQIQAAIAACHSNAATAQETDWREISALYGELLRHDPQPVHEANRAIAVAEVDGPAAALEILDTLAIEGYHAYQAARADLLRRAGSTEAAVTAYERALELAGNPAERAFLRSRLDELGVRRAAGG